MINNFAKKFGTGEDAAVYYGNGNIGMMKG